MDVDLRQSATATADPAMAGRRPWRLPAAIAVVALLVLGGGYFAWKTWFAGGDPSTRYTTATVQRGDLETHPLHSFCSAISVGIVDGRPVLDLPYVEDSRAEVDMNVVMLAPVAGGEARFVEVQGTAEGMAFTRGELDALLALAEGGLARIVGLQRETVAAAPPVR